MATNVFRSRDAQILNPNIHKVILRAYVLGYLTTTGPRLLSFVRILFKQDVSKRDKASYLVHALSRAFRWTSFPTFCALVVGGSASLETILKLAVAKIRANPRATSSQREIQFIRFLSTLLTSLSCFPLLNSRSRPESKPNEIRDAPDAAEPPQRPGPPELAGRTLDLTLFTATRALDVLGCAVWKRWKTHRRSRNKWTRFEAIIPQLSDASLFATSAAIVMWAWFYLPERLPYSYGRWISEAAQVDHRLIDALRSCRRGEWSYGKPIGDQVILQDMCRDYGWPEEWGDPSKTVPIPCEMVHMGCSPSCEVHAIWRFAKAFTFACSTYFPLQIMLQWRSPSVKGYVRAAKSAARSSTFLGLFITLFYYSVCLARTRLGPRIFSRKRVTPEMWESGLGVGAGCAMCGWSILVENARRRGEIALFVAPRAAATMLPRRYDRKYLWRENVAFSLSAAVLLTAVQGNPHTIRGVLAKILGRVYN